MLYRELLSKLTAHEDLLEEEIAELLTSIKNDELSEVQIAGFLVALLMKGPTAAELTAIARAMRQHCTPITPNIKGEILDTCGTGGGPSTFNISTATAIVAAAAGIPVAKHGSRAISSVSGSADVLEALGIHIHLHPRALEKMIEEIGIAFIFAPLYHPVMAKVLMPEKALGIKSVFYSVIGPLINPTSASRHLLGVYRADLVDVIGVVAQSIGYTDVMVVHGADGVDEISLTGKTRILEIRRTVATDYEISPEDLGLERCTLGDIAAQEPPRNAEIIRGVFSGKFQGATRDAVVINTAGALKVGGKVHTLTEGVVLARELIDTGAATHKLNQFIDMSHSFRD